MFSKAKLTIIILSAVLVAYGFFGGLVKHVSAGDDVYLDLSIFTDVLSKVKDDYVEKPDMTKAMHGALQGMMEALDPYSSFVDRETVEKYGSVDPSTSAGPGLILSKRYGYAYVVSVVPGSPAARLGFRTGDLLESVGGAGTPLMSLWEMKRILAGPEGSSIKARVVRSRNPEPAEVVLKRERLKAPEVTARVIEDGIGLIRIPTLEEGTAEEVETKWKILQTTGIRGLVVDLRGNAEGTLDEAVKISDLFLDKGEKIVTVRDRSGAETEYKASSDASIPKLPVVLIVDGGTSGAAEVFTAALQDEKACTVVGQRTDGRGSEQQSFYLGDGSLLLISTKLFLRPSGHALQEQAARNSGIRPDVRSPSDDFVANFYFENAPDNVDKRPGEGFYRKLNEAIETEQFNTAVEQVRSRLLKKAA